MFPTNALFGVFRRSSWLFASQKSLLKRGAANSGEGRALNWGTRGRRFKSRQPDGVLS